MSDQQISIIRITEDTSRDIGHAIITVQGLPGNISRMLYGLKRYGHAEPYMGENGWQGPVAWLKPVAAWYQDNTVQFVVGPDVTTLLEPTVLELLLQGDGLEGEVTIQFFWDNKLPPETPSEKSRGVQIIDGTEMTRKPAVKESIESKELKEQEPPTKTAPPQSQPSLPKALAPPAATPVPPVSKQTDTSEKTGTLPPRIDNDKPEKPNRSFLIFIVLVGVALALLALILYLIFSYKKDEAPANLSSPPPLEDSFPSAPAEPVAPVAEPLTSESRGPNTEQGVEAVNRPDAGESAQQRTNAQAGEVAAPVQPPVIRNDSVRCGYEQSVAFDPLANDSSSDGTPLRLHSVSSPLNGMIHRQEDGHLLYQANKGFHGGDQVQYSVLDNNGKEFKGRVSITVTPLANKPPVPAADTAVSDQKRIVLDVLANDYDPDGDPLKVTGLTRPQKGRASILDERSIEYIPLPDESGEDSFTYTATDNHDNSGEARVVIRITRPVSIRDDLEKVLKTN